MIILQFLTRLLAFVGKELVEVIRRPGAIVSLILGPFLIMALFGFGYSGFRRGLQTIIVIPPETGLPTDVQTYASVATGLEIQEVVPDPEPALQKLRERTVDAVVIAPKDVEQRFRAGEQSEIEIHINVVDPVQEAYAGFLAAMMVNQVNARIIERAAEEGATYAVEAGADEAALIPPEVVAAPTKALLVNDAPVKPGYVPFYGPAVLALILQHLAVTLIALSLVRERTSGVIELFRIAPISTFEVLLGKLLAFGLLAAAISAATLGLLVGILGVPFEADPLVFIGVMGLLTLASLAIGLFIAVVSDSGAPGGPALAPRPAGVGLLQRFRPAGRGVPGGDPRCVLLAAGHPRDPAAAGPDAAWLDVGHVDVPRPGGNRRRHAGAHLAAPPA